MTTEKQLIANIQNAQLSTGPTTAGGKVIIATNAIKHGIFTKDLILSSDIENENEDDYQEIMNNLQECLSPCNQMESLLVEKIAVDFWRLRRTIRFETGSIAKGIKKILDDFYSYGKQNNQKIDEQIVEKSNLLAWNLSYIECLTKNEVTFDKPKWEGKYIYSDIVEDFYLIAKSISSLSKFEKEMLYNSHDLDFDKLQALLIKYGYSETKAISTKLIDLYTQQNQQLEKEVEELQNQKLLNDASNKLTYMLGMIPQADNTDKVLKYERSLQKSIYQNLIMLKKLQGLF
jgi:hypothetical protein